MTNDLIVFCIGTATGIAVTLLIVWAATRVPKVETPVEPPRAVMPLPQRQALMHVRARAAQLQAEMLDDDTVPNVESLTIGGMNGVQTER